MTTELEERINRLESENMGLREDMMKVKYCLNDHKLFCKYLAEYMLHKFGFNIWLRLQMVKNSPDFQYLDGEESSLIPAIVPSMGSIENIGYSNKRQYVKQISPFDSTNVANTSSKRVKSTSAVTEAHRTNSITSANVTTVHDVDDDDVEFLAVKKPHVHNALSTQMQSSVPVQPPTVFMVPVMNSTNSLASFHPSMMSFEAFTNVTQFGESNPIVLEQAEVERVLDYNQHGGSASYDSSSNTATNCGGQDEIRSRTSSDFPRNRVEIIHDEYSDPSIDIKYEAPRVFDEDEQRIRIVSSSSLVTSTTPALKVESSVPCLSPLPKTTDFFDLNWLYQMKKYQELLMPYKLLITHDEYRQWFEYLPNEIPQLSRYRCRLCYRYLQKFLIPRGRWGPVESEQGVLRRSAFENATVISKHPLKKSHAEVIRRLQKENNPDLGYPCKLDSNLRKRLLDTFGVAE